MYTGIHTQKRCLTCKLALHLIELVSYFSHTKHVSGLLRLRKFIFFLKVL